MRTAKPLAPAIITGTANQSDLSIFVSRALSRRDKPIESTLLWNRLTAIWRQIAARTTCRMARAHHARSSCLRRPGTCQMAPPSQTGRPKPRRLPSGRRGFACGPLPPGHDNLAVLALNVIRRLRTTTHPEQRCRAGKGLGLPLPEQEQRKQPRQLPSSMRLQSLQSRSACRPIVFRWRAGWSRRRSASHPLPQSAPLLPCWCKTWPAPRSQPRSRGLAD
jgi:hypothetical protein